MLNRLRVWWCWSLSAQRLRRLLWCRWFGHDMDQYEGPWKQGLGGDPPEQGDPVWYCKRCDLDESKEVSPPMATPTNGESRTSVHQDQTPARHPWEGLFAWGDQFQAATGITHADIDRAVKQVRQDEAQTPPAPMDTVRSMLTDVEAAATRGDGQAVDQGFDEAINALMAMQERYKREAGTWAADRDTQSSSVLDAELPALIPE